MDRLHTRRILCSRCIEKYEEDLRVKKSYCFINPSNTGNLGNC